MLIWTLLIKTSIDGSYQEKKTTVKSSSLCVSISYWGDELFHFPSSKVTYGALCVIFVTFYHKSINFPLTLGTPA